MTNDLNTSGVLINAPSCWAIETPTASLRFLNGTLQQWWRIESHGKIDFEWRDVPIVTEDNND
jgi:hypothetical protein